ncbi:MAG: cation-translocating P-type ATPase [Candidatus Gracilibacteria bacterium]|nr:cation-translocating P-type ATPase [Candidatus Gracilibacteria bacterium]
MPKNIYQQLGSSKQGLTHSKISKLRQQYGPNEIVHQNKTSIFKMLLRQFTDLMVIILLIAAGISYFSGETSDAIEIMAIVLLNGIIGFVQEFKADKAIAALQKMLTPHARVRRNGREEIIAAKDLVPGDLLVLAEGDAVPADAYVVSENELAVQEAVLTGESIPVTKDALSTTSKIKDRQKIYMGTLVTHGQATAVVFATGMQTEFGKIASLTSKTEKEHSPLQKELKTIGILVSKITIVISLLLILGGIFLQGKTFLETIMFAVSVAVAAVPEGLPATITIALALGVQKLAKQNAIVKKLSSVETLGSTTVICSDKTGTLTKNEMTVKEIWTNNYLLAVEGSGYETEGVIEIVHPIINKANGTKLINGNLVGGGQSVDQAQELLPALTLLAQAAALNNNARLILKKGQVQILGDPTEAALLVMAEKNGLSTSKIVKEYPRLKEIPFDSDRKMMSTLQKIEGKLISFTKGSPDQILAICKYIYLNGQKVPLTAALKKKLKDHYEQMAQKALRVLAFAYKELEQVPQNKKELAQMEEGLTLLGLAGMIDPPREEVAAACQQALSAGIKIYIVTGDYGPTAAAIAKQIGLQDLEIVSGAELDKWDDAKLSKFLKKEGRKNLVFARVRAEHKRWIVDILKKHGEIVAVTGDGVNDAPALKRADIGIAMGLSGTDVSREAANMVLADDSFASIVAAVREGRRIYENLKKFIFYIFSCNIGELLTIFAGLLLGMPAPLTAVLILSIDLGTDVLPAVALGVDPAEKNIMQKAPRDPQSRIMNKGFIERFVYLGTIMGLLTLGAYLGSLFLSGWQWGTALADDDFIHRHASTIAFSLLVLIQIVNAYNSRSAETSCFRMNHLKNPQLLGASLISILMVIVMVETPFMQRVLHTTHLSGMEWLTVIGLSFSVLIFEEGRKLVARSK